MKRGELKRMMREQRRVLRERLQAARGRVAAMKKKPVSRKRQAARALGIAVIIALLFVDQCECDPSPAPEAAVAPLRQKPPKKAPPKKRAKLDGKLDGLDRGDYIPATPDAHAWLDDLRLQVTARSPKLAECFRGAERPSALRWTVAVQPREGTVSEQAIEALDNAMLSTAQVECVTGVLASPRYRLRATEDQSTPVRVSLVVEF